jgi:hypothetical protein
MKSLPIEFNNSEPIAATSDPTVKSSMLNYMPFMKASSYSQIPLLNNPPPSTSVLTTNQYFKHLPSTTTTTNLPVKPSTAPKPSTIMAGIS